MVLKKIFRNSTGRLEYALVSKTNPKKVLFWFGINKPNHEEFMHQERRIQFFKNKQRRKNFRSFPKRRIWIKRKDKVKQRYWVEGKIQLKNYGSVTRVKDEEFPDLIRELRIKGRKLQHTILKTEKTQGPLKFKIDATDQSYISTIERPQDDVTKVVETRRLENGRFVTMRYSAPGQSTGENYETYISDTPSEARDTHKKQEISNIFELKRAPLGYYSKKHKYV